MDQEHPERGGNADEEPENTPESGDNGRSDPENAPEVPDASESGGDLPDLPPEALVSLTYDPRAAIAKALGDVLDVNQVAFLIGEVLLVNKKVPIELHCTNCGHKQRRYALIPDAKAVVSALTDLLAQGFGRPGEAKLDEGTVNFRRYTNLTELEEDVA
jgi:hypothetical protein